MKEKLTREEVQKEYDAVNVLLEDPDIPARLKFDLEQRKKTLAILLMNHWLPRDSERKLIMLLIFLIGISGAVISGPSWLFILLILPPFSPKIAIKASIIMGFLLNNQKNNF